MTGRNGGRPEKILVRNGTPARDFAYWLRDLRRRAGLTYDQLARKTTYSISTLQEACAGRRLPTRAVVEAIVRACDANEQSIENWLDYWAIVKRASDSSVRPFNEAAFTPPWLNTTVEDPLHTTLVNDATEKADGATASVAPPNGQPRHRKLGTLGWLAAATVCAAVALMMVVALSGNPVSMSPHGGWRWEEEFHRGGAPVFADVRDLAGLTGPTVRFRQRVQISCKMLAPVIPSVSPDGYWYRLASAPWGNRFYAAANTFLNGDNPAGPYLHNTDMDVPDC